MSIAATSLNKLYAFSGLRASTMADATHFSMPRPGAQDATVSRLFGLTAIVTSAKPASRSKVFGAFGGNSTCDAAA